MDANSVKLRIAFQITSSEDKSLKCTMVSVDQGNAKVPADSVTAKDGTLSVDLKKLGGGFDGKWNETTGEVVGEFKQGGRSYPLTLKKVDLLPGNKRPQDPVPPYPYRVQEVTFTNEKDNVTLHGTLTLPNREGPYPCAILISGSGSQDRNEELMGHRPFLVLSHFITVRGIAILRFDDRGFTDPQSSVKATSVNFADDVMAGFEFLKKHPEINPQKIGLIGHSEGGLIAPMLAAREKEIAFIVMIAGPGISGDQILLLQGATVRRQAKQDEATIEKERLTSIKVFEIIANEPEDGPAMEKIVALWKEENPNADEKEKETMVAQTKQLLTPWFRYFLSYDPKPALTKVTCPVLSLFGEKDFQVPPEQNMHVVEEALKEGGNKDFTVREMKGLNHLMQPCESGMVDEYSKIETTMSMDVLLLMGDWIKLRMYMGIE
jgi:pimeloyl-ACP methyl ester carboxylesterase